MSKKQKQNTYSAIVTSTGGQKYADPDVFVSGRFQPEYRIDKGRHNELVTLAYDIAENGQMQPVVAIKKADLTEENYLTTEEVFHGEEGMPYQWNQLEIVSGHRRVEAIRMIKAGDGRELWNERTGGMPIWVKVNLIDPDSSEADIFAQQFSSNYMREDYDDFELGQQFRIARRVLRLTQDDLAMKLGINQSKISRYEKFAHDPVVIQIYEEWVTGELAELAESHSSMNGEFISPANAQPILIDELDRDAKLDLLRQAVALGWPQRRIKSVVKATLAGLEAKDAATLVEQAEERDEGTQQIETRAKAVAREKTIQAEAEAEGDQEKVSKSRLAQERIINGEVPVAGDERAHVVGDIARNIGGKKDQPTGKKEPQFNEAQGEVARKLNHAIGYLKAVETAWKQGMFGDGHEHYFKKRLEKVADLASDTIVLLLERSFQREDPEPEHSNASIPASVEDNTPEEDEPNPRVSTEEYTPSSSVVMSIDNDKSGGVVFKLDNQEEEPELRPDGLPK